MRNYNFQIKIRKSVVKHDDELSNTATISQFSLTIKTMMIIVRHYTVLHCTVTAELNCCYVVGNKRCHAE